MNFYDSFMTEFPVPVSASPKERIRINSSQVALFNSVKSSVASGLDRETAWSNAKAEVRKVKSSALVWFLWFLINSGLLSKMFAWLWNRRNQFEQQPEISDTVVDSPNLMR